MPAVITKKNVGQGDGSLVLLTYTGLDELDTNVSPINLAEWSDVSVHVVGTFNAGTVTIEGTNFENGTNFTALNDPQGNPLSFTTARMEQLMEIAYLIRPRVTAGTGVSVNVAFLLKRASSLRT
jgi:hypothetical protein